MLSLYIHNYQVVYIFILYTGPFAYSVNKFLHKLALSSDAVQLYPSPFQFQK
jgi:hypothetical protein